jgi:hypothetical protein
VDLTGYTDVTLQLWAKVDDFECDEFAAAGFSYDGITWTPLKIWTDADDDDTYHYVEIDLTQFLPANVIFLSFDAQMGQVQDRFFVDDIQLVGW